MKAASVAQELREAHNGLLDWVRPAVAAEAMGCKERNLKYWRQSDKTRAPGVKAKCPKYKAVEGKRWTIEYEWASVLALSRKSLEMMGAEEHDQARELKAVKASMASMKVEVATLKEQLAMLLARLGEGASALTIPTQWLVDDQHRIRGHNALCDVQPTWTTTTKTWLEALDMPWESQELREPYQLAALKRLDDVRKAAENRTSQ